LQPKKNTYYCKNSIYNDLFTNIVTFYDYGINILIDIILSQILMFS